MRAADLAFGALASLASGLVRTWIASTRALPMGALFVVWLVVGRLVRLALRPPAAKKPSSLGRL